ncbi:SpoIIE family protein phosphatase [Streptomyces sp. NPDC055966]|uniref:SpoIIE family protein phosphatase n=1 Tax=Streptomyces sp. NPDC055966 TaxID=3345669 RepID=UPI0035DF2FE7
MLNCGHPPPLLIHGEQVTVLNSRRPAPPLGLCALCVRNDRADPLSFETGDMLLLYTDRRDRSPLTDRSLLPARRAGRRLPRLKP